MPRTQIGVLKNGSPSIYEKDDRTFKLEVSQKGITRAGITRTISLAKFGQRKIAADVLSAENRYTEAFVSIQFDVPDEGYTNAEIDAMRAGIFAWCDTAMTNALRGRQS